MRKKWTEAEERTLIDKYGEMISDGTLPKMKTREKKYKPIALYVNSVHHRGDPIAYPWEWSWKDVSNKVQNMRHQYSLVKHKIARTSGEEDGFDWVEGLTHWSNFLRYKEVFGDVTIPLPYGANNNNNNDNNDNDNDNGFDEFANVGDYQNGVMGLDFHYDGNGEDGYGEVGTMVSEKRKKKKAKKNLEKKAWTFVANQLAQLREMEARYEQREEERERVREEETKKVMERLRERKDQELEVMEKERRRRKEEEMVQERKWERKRAEWNARIDEMLSEHRAEMAQFQARILDEQQNVTSQLLGMVSSGIGDNADGGGASGHYLSQMMQNLQHVGGMVDGEGQVDGHNQDDEFIVDG